MNPKNYTTLIQNLPNLNFAKICQIIEIGNQNHIKDYVLSVQDADNLSKLLKSL